MKNLIQSKSVKILAIAAVVFTVQKFNDTPDVEQTAQAQQESFHKASLSCQNWKKDGYGKLMGCE